MDKWLSNANETLAECLGVGDQQSTQIKLSTINVSSFLIKIDGDHQKPILRIFKRFLLIV